MVYRVYVEKKPSQAHEAKSLKNDVVSFLGIKGLDDVRVINRYDAENITAETFRLYYCARPDGTRYNEPPKEPGTVWSKEKGRLVPAKWNNVEQKWEEIIDKQQNP